MKIENIYSKFKDLFKECAPLYSNLIILIFIILGIILRLNIDTFDNYKRTLFITLGIFILHFSIVFILCKKKFKKTAYFIAYLPFILVIIQSILFIYESIVTFNEIVKEVKTEEENQGSNPNNSHNRVQS
jgi:glucan phosphoethanolaminetransferase (alkaline phosphatase superfamily)